MINLSGKNVRFASTLSGVLLLSMVSGCASRQLPVDYVQSNKHLPTEEKIAYITSFKSLTPGSKVASTLSWDDSNDYCNTLLDCAIYTKDYQLAKWLIENLDTFYVRKSTGLLSNDFEYYSIASPLVHNLSDDEASLFLSLMLDNGFKPNRCSHSVTTPLNLAIDKGYIKSARTLLEHNASYSATKCKSTVIHDGMNGNKTVQRTVEGALAHAILNADETKPVTYEMISLLLDYKDDFTVPSNYYPQCDYASSSTTLYAYCVNKYQIERHIIDYYRSTDRIDDKRRKQLLLSISEYKDRSRRSEQQKRREIAAARKYEQEMKALLDAGDSDSESSFQPFELSPSVAEQLGSTSTSTNLSTPATRKETQSYSSEPSEISNVPTSTNNDSSNARKDAYIHGEVRCISDKILVVTQTFKISCSTMTNCIKVADEYYNRIFKEIKAANATVRNQDEGFCSVMRDAPQRTKAIDENIRAERIQSDKNSGIKVEYYTY